MTTYAPTTPRHEVTFSDLDSEFNRRLACRELPDAPFHEAGRSYEHEDRRITEAIRSLRESERPLRILEAGCGNQWPIDLGNLEYRLIGIDIDAEALRIRTTVHGDLDESIHGDICAVALPESEFDVVYSAFVLEHVERADLALENMVRSLRPGGLMILRLPDPQSARGFVTRRTPFWFHVLFAKYVEKRPNAGQPGYAPYPVFYHPCIWRDSLLSRNSAQLKCFWTISDDFAREEAGLLGAAARKAAKAIELLSLGRLRSGHANMIYFFRKAR